MENREIIIKGRRNPTFKNWCEVVNEIEKDRDYMIDAPEFVFKMWKEKIVGVIKKISIDRQIG